MACCLLHNLIKKEMGGYQMDEDDDVDHGGENNVEDDNEELVTSIEPSNEWTNFRKNLASNMFNTWRAQRNTS